MKLHKVKLFQGVHVGPDMFGPGWEIGHDGNDANAAIVRSTPLNTRDHKNLSLVVRAGVVVKNISLGEATEDAVCVQNTPGANASSVCELVFFLLGLLMRNILPSLEYVKLLRGQKCTESAEALDDEIEKNKAQFKGRELRGQTIGVVGLGNIGTPVALLASHYGMRVLWYDPNPRVPLVGTAFTRIHNLFELVRQCDIVTVHVTPSAATRHLISRQHMAEMKAGDILINTSRPDLCDEQAVLEFLLTGHLGGYISDIPDLEVLAELDHPRLIVTNHIGASTPEAENRCLEMAVPQILDFFNLGTVRHSLNFPTVDLPRHPLGQIRLVVITENKPGMEADIKGLIRNRSLNIEGSINQGRGTIGYNLIDIGALPTGLLNEIQGIEGVKRVRAIHF